MIDLLSNLEPLSDDVIQLDPHAVAHARQVARSQPSSHQWQTYLNALAVLGFEQWLAERAEDVAVTRDRTPAASIEANGFRIHLIPTQPDTLVDVPRALVADPAHFYVALALYEESSQLELIGILRHDQLAARLPTLVLDADDTYPIPLAWFEPECDRIVLYLRCAEPTPLALPEPPVAGAAPLPPAVTSQAAISHAVINVGLWLRNQLDALADELAWALLPTLSTEMRPATGVGLRLSQTETGRLPADELYGLLRQVERHGLQLPQQWVSGYRDWEMANIPLRLYIVTGDCSTPEQAEWMLLLILGPQPGSHLPTGLSLQVSTPTERVLEQTFTPETGDYLIAQVVGTHAEHFTVTLTLPEGLALTLPAFAFQPA